jgi:perosamine synthetase
MAAESLAIDGGTPVRTAPFPERRPFGPEEEEQVLQALRSQNLFYPTGKKVYEFLERFRALYGVEHVVPSTSGTSAIHVALGAVDLDPGQEVIVTPISDMGSVAPILLCNCIPVFADVDPDTFNLDPHDVADKITDRTGAIIAVHCWGRPAEMDEICQIARERDIPVIEDCAQSHFVRYKGRLTGTIGQLGAFSFQQSKHMTCGDGGATIVNDEALARRADLYVDKGCDWTPDRKYRLQYAFLAPCYRMTELQGAVLLAQVSKLPRVVRKRTELGDLLTSLISGVPGVVPPPPSDDDHGHGYWAYPFRVDEAALGATCEEFKRALQAEGVGASTWIGKPLYMFRSLTEKITYGASHYPFQDRPDVAYGEGLCPRAEEACRQLAVIWFNEEWSEADIRDAARAIRKVAEGLRARKRET